MLKWILVAAFAVGSVVAGYKFVGIRHDLARQRAEIDVAWKHVEAAMNKRADPVPPLREPLSESQFDPRQFDAARQSLASANGPAEKIRANREISLVLAKLLLACETHPRLRQNGSFERVREALA